MTCLRLLGLIVLFTAIDSSAGTTTVAVVGVGPESQSVADTLTRGITASWIKVIPALTAAQALDLPIAQPVSTQPTPASQPAMKLDPPDLLMVVRHSQTTPDLWRLTICNVAWGTCLADRVWDVKDQALNVAAMAALLNQAVMEPIPPSARPVILLPIESADFSQTREKDCDAIQIALEEEIRSRGMALLDLNDAALIGQQRAAAQMPALSIPDPLIFSGKLKHAGGADDVVVTLELNCDGRKISEFSSQPMPLQKCADRVDLYVNPLLDAAPPDHPAREASAIQKDMRSVARSLRDSGRLADALTVLEAALLLDPNNAELQGDCARTHGKVLTSRINEMQRAIGDLDWDAKKAQEAKVVADNSNDATWGLFHIRAYCAACNVSIMKNNWEDMPLQLTTGFAPFDRVRQVILQVMRAKQRNHTKDSFSRYIIYFMQQQRNKMSEAEQLAYMEQLGDVWTQQEKDNSLDLYSWSTYVNGPAQTPTATFTTLVSYLEQSGNPDARVAAGKIRDRWAHPVIAQAKPHSATGPAAAAPAPIAKFVDFALPRRPEADSCSFVPAGPTDDIYLTAKSDIASLYYMRGDATGRLIGEMVGRGSPCFDGRYVWFLGKKDDQTIINAYDTTTDQLLTTSKQEDYPRDLPQLAYFATTEPGNACVAVQFGTQSNRTWIGLLNVDPASRVHCKIALSCASTADAAKNAPAPIDHAFTIGGVYCLPGPPGAKEQATPQYYIVRLFLRGALRVNPADGTCSVEDGRGVKPTRGDWIIDHDKVYQNGQIWDPRTDQAMKGPTVPPAFGEMLVNGKIYAFMDTDLLQAKPGEKLIKAPIDAPRSMYIGMRYTYSNLFGLVADGGKRLVPLDNHSDIPRGSIEDADTWMRKYAGNIHNADLFETLATRASIRGDEDDWAAELVEAVKYYKPQDTLRSALDHAQEQVELTNYYLHRGDYKTAEQYATGAADVGSSWSFDACGDVAEAMGQWDRSEQFMRDIARSYSPWEWYCWCARTGHGDLQAARAQLLDALDRKAAKDAKDTSNAYDRGFVFVIDGDFGSAAPLLLKAVTDGPHPLAGVELAMQAADAGNIAERDRLLELASKAPEDNYLPIPNMYVPILQAYFKNDGKLNPAALKQVQNIVGTRWDKTELYYCLGRAALSRHDKAQAIQYLQHAAALPQNCMARTMAGIYLRKLGEPLPLPGQWKD